MVSSSFKVAMDLIKIFSREYSVQYTEVAIRALRFEARSHLPALVLSQSFIPEQGNEACYVDRREWDRFLAALQKTYGSAKTLSGFLRAFHRYGRAYIATARRIGTKKLEALTNRELLQLYQTYQHDLILYSAYLWMGFFLNTIYSEKAKKLLEGRVIPEDAMTALFSPRKRTGVLLLHDTLQRLRAEKRLSKTRLRAILRAYAWMSCLDVHNDPWTEKELRHLAQSLPAVTKGYSFARAARAAQLTSNEREFFTRVRELVYVKDMRDEYRRRGVYYILPLFGEIALRLRVSRQELAHFSYDEICAALQHSTALSHAVARKRQKGFLIYFHKRRCMVTTDTATIKRFIRRSVEKMHKTDEQSVLRGQTASPGHVRGTVTIVSSVRDCANVKKGDIMIAITTHPDFVPAMQRAAAIVTDEGGLTSHAAIVSREMKKPCVVGTKTATTIFKNGDHVEVDATRGIVRKRDS